MQRHEMIDAMRALGLKGMAGAFDEEVRHCCRSGRSYRPKCQRRRTYRSPSPARDLK